jgi:hypothetical protein
MTAQLLLVSFEFARGSQKFFVQEEMIIRSCPSSRSLRMSGRMIDTLDQRAGGQMMGLSSADFPALLLEDEINHHHQRKHDQQERGPASITSSSCPCSASGPSLASTGA